MKQATILILFLVTFFLACDSKPTKIEPLNSNDKKENPISNTAIKNHMGQKADEGVHKIVVTDSLSTSRYVYLKVKEGSKNYWISTWKMPFKKGDVFYYKGGILKLNFYSKEHNTYFDTLYLISKISKVPVFTKTSAIDKVKTQDNSNSATINNKTKEGAIALSQLFASPEEFKGKVIKIGGKCTKVNINIMGKNWVHIQEKDKNGKLFNLVVTTQDPAKVGENCYFEGKIDTKLDLGAGYFFDVIMQEGKRIY